MWIFIILNLMKDKWLFIFFSCFYRNLENFDFWSFIRLRIFIIRGGGSGVVKNIFENLMNVMNFFFRKKLIIYRKFGMRFRGIY